MSRSHPPRPHLIRKQGTAPFRMSTQPLQPQDIPFFNTLRGNNIPCSEGSNSVPENSHPPRSSACDLLWKQCLCRYHQLRGHPGSAWALNPMTGSYKKTLRDIERTRSRDNGGRGRRDAATRQGRLQDCQKLEDARKDSPQSLGREPGPAHALISGV